MSGAAEAVTQSWGITTKSTPSGAQKSHAGGCRTAQPRTFFCCKLPSRCLTVTGEGNTTLTAKWNNTAALHFPLTIICVSPSPGRKTLTFPVGINVKMKPSSRYFSQAAWSLQFFCEKGHFSLYFLYISCHHMFFYCCFWFGGFLLWKRKADKNLEQRVKWWIWSFYWLQVTVKYGF